MKKEDQFMLSQIKKESGQTMVEVLVALTIAVFVVISLLVVILSGLKNSQFAQNQSKATKYAQEAIEKIKAIRDRDLVVTFANPSSSCYTPLQDLPHYTTFSSLWNCNLSSETLSPCTTSPSGGSPEKVCYFRLNTAGGALTLNEAVDSADINDVRLGDGLTRQIFIEDKTTPADDDYTQQKMVTVKVLWSDSSGSHESNVQTLLTPK